MHGVNRSLLQALSATATTAPRTFAAGRALAEAPAPTQGTRHRFRSFLRTPGPGEAFSAGGRVEDALAGNEGPLRLLMRKLSARIERERWTTPIRPDVAASENPHIHSGYTYLLQLVAHDLVQSSQSLAGSASGAAGVANTRLFPLALDTIYGGGPDVCPYPYEIDKAHANKLGIVPRIKFRFGQIRKIDRTITSSCPFADIARAVPANVGDSGLSPADQLNFPGMTEDPWRTEALIADVRNDDHALISQTTALFHALHNLVIDMIPESGALARYSPSERAYRRFFCARFVVTLIYRQIIVKDLLALILHPDVYENYRNGRLPLLDVPADAAADAIPAEFSSGVFRFAHSMVRDRYKVNSEDVREFSDALKLSSTRMPAALPVSTAWEVDWSRFFKICEREPNYSHRIGPVYSGPLTDSSSFDALTQYDRSGLPDRDLVTGCYSGLWSVPPLCRELRGRGLEQHIPDYDEWKPIVRAWLEKRPNWVDHDLLSPEEVRVITEDPPLLLFTLLEAAQPISGAARSVSPASGESLHLGALGSVVVSETILGSIKRNPIAFEDAASNLKDRVRAVCGALVDDAGALADIPDFSKMPEIIDFMIERGALKRPR